MIPVFIGYDPVETVGFHVLSHSIMARASEPVSITPLMLQQLPLTRPRDPKQSTEFAFSRFLVPWLCGYKGHAIFMDSDMLCRGDIAELWRKRDHYDAVQVVKHPALPQTGTKFLGHAQHPYRCKNWSSVMLFNNRLCERLTPDYVDTALGLALHQFDWVERAEQIGRLPSHWNHLVGVNPPMPDAKLVHFTQGLPCFPDYAECEFADEWAMEFCDTMSYGKR